MKALSRTIVFGRYVDDKKTFTPALAVFPNIRAAQAYKAQLSAACKSGDAETLKSLSAAALLDAAGAVRPGILFALTEVPYAPGIETPESKDDTFEL